MPQLVQAAKKHLSQRIQHVDDKLEQQKEISVQIRDQVLWNSISFAWKRTPDVLCSFKQKEQIWKRMYNCEASFHELFTVTYTVKTLQWTEMLICYFCIIRWLYKLSC